MASPFPGMDPYLERRWRDVHQKLITYIGDALQPNLPPDLVTRAEERIYVESETYASPRPIEPDLLVRQEHGYPTGPARDSVGGVVAAKPFVVSLLPDPVTESFLQIEDVAGRVITVIEVLSPSNRLPGEGQALYRRKQKELIASDVSLVEIDFVRAGRSVVMVPPAHRPRSATYCVCVKRGSDRTRGEYYPITLRQPLPIVSIPLRATDGDALLDLQALIQQVYRNGRYEHLDYTTPCEPPLEPEEEAWADGLLRAAGRR
jgi:hypothetical protein